MDSFRAGEAFECIMFANPADSGITFEIQPGESTNMILRIFNLAGQEIWQRSLTISEEQRVRVFWSGCTIQKQLVASGVYFYHLNAGVESRSGKVIILRQVSNMSFSSIYITNQYISRGKK